jgi:hypothetical protein
LIYTHLWELVTDNYQHRMPLLVGMNPPKNFYQKLSLEFIPNRAGSIPATPVLGTVFEKLTTALTVIEAADSALDGDYATAAFKVAIEGVGLYSNSLGLLLAAGEAVKADWDAFAKRVYARDYRKFYEYLYYSGGPRPSLRVYKKGRQARLRTFMNEVHDELTGGDVGGASKLAAGGFRSANFRKMIMDFAHYRLERTLTRADFETTPGRRGRLVFKNQYLRSIFVALFHDFEKTYQDDLNVEMMRKIAIKQAKFLRDKTSKTGGQLAWAENGRFDKVWTNRAELNDAYCKAIAKATEKMGGQGVLK